MADVIRANHIAGEWRPAARGARFQVAGPGSGRARAAPAPPDDGWPQSNLEDLQLVTRVGREGGRAWRALAPERRAEAVRALADALVGESALEPLLAARFGLSAAECAPHRELDAAEIETRIATMLAHKGPVQPVSAPSGLAWIAPDWRLLAAGALLAVVRELLAARAVVLFSDARLPELGACIARAAEAAELPRGAFALVHGVTRELVAQALGAAEAGDALVASGRVERMVELRRALGERRDLETRLTALRCASYEVDRARHLEDSAHEVLVQAFGRSATLSGQLGGALARVFCPARLFARFSELLLAGLESSAELRPPVPQIDAEAGALARAAWELGLDEGATLIAGGDDDENTDAVLAPAVLTNVEPGMACARRQDPLPVLCLLRCS